jgi:hypothetical protein
VLVRSSPRKRNALPWSYGGALRVLFDIRRENDMETSDTSPIEKAMDKVIASLESKAEEQAVVLEQEAAAIRKKAKKKAAALRAKAAKKLDSLLEKSEKRVRSESKRKTQQSPA